MEMRIFLLGLLLTGGLTASDPRVFASGPEQVRLIELFTSEGCSSCPPAEKWLGALRDHPGLWRDFVPVAFHVAYWDHLGWKDRFASQRFTGRQHGYAGHWGSRSVYTPCFVLDGREWRDRRAPARGAPTGSLTVEITTGLCRVAFPPAPGTRYEAHVALLGADITSRVKNGENAGRTLRHDFVALALVSVPLARGAAEITLPESDQPGIGRRAVAVWITRAGSPEPVQATGGWLD